MARESDHIDATDIGTVNERLAAWAGGDAAIRPVQVERVVIADDAIDALVDVARSLARGGRVMLVVDRTPMLRGSDDVKALVADRLGSAAPFTTWQLQDGAHTEPLPYGRGSDTESSSRGDPEPGSADLELARRLAGELHGYAGVVSLGSGSVTDVVKYARHLAVESGHVDSLSMISFPTAASVTAYTSALAVLTVDGVKRTLPARAPDAVVCDLRTLADAPKSLTLAGFGDVLARSVAYGDWFIANELGMSNGFSELPGRLLEHAEQAMIDQANGLATGDASSIRCVLDGLLLAGMAMSIVNQTAPVSGWEHVISHYLDLTASADQRQPAWHGAQVGAATLVAARAYEAAWPDLDLPRIEQDADPTAYRRLVERQFRPLDPDGRMAAEIWRDLEKKLVRWNGAEQTHRTFVQRKQAGEFDEFLAANVRSSAAVADALSRATAPKRFGDLNQPIPRATTLAAIQRSHLIRSRFTLGDLLFHSGWLDQQAAASLLDAG